MVLLRRRALLLAAAVSVLVVALGGALALRTPPTGSEGTRTSYHQIVADHDAGVTARAAADRAPLDLRQVHSKLPLLAWVGMLLASAVLARTAGRTVEVRTRRSASAVRARPRSNRGPPATSFA